MVRYFLNDPLHRRRKGCRYILAFSWLSGIICGILLSLTAEERILPLMRGAVYTPVSITWLLCVSVLPFLLSTFVVFHFVPAWLLLICFAKAFLFAFVSMVILMVYASAGWLVWLMLLFCDLVTLPILYWFWMRYLFRYDRPSVVSVTGIFSLMLLAGSIHAWFISPYLVRLIEI